MTGNLPEFPDSSTRLILGDCLVELAKIPDNSMDCIISDPPYGISFMGANWDKALPDAAVWRECLRVLKPGGFAFIMALPRMFHRLAVAVEDAGFWVHTPLAWAYATGFPKALDVGKVIDRRAGTKRERVGSNSNDRTHRDNVLSDYGLQGGVGKGDVTAPATPLAREWDGWKVGNSCLKPAYEFVGWFQKPISEKTLVDNLVKYGVGGINAKAGAIPTSENTAVTISHMGKYSLDGQHGNFRYAQGVKTTGGQPEGRFPANLLVEDDCLDDGKDHESGAGNKNTTNRDCLYGSFGQGIGDGLGGDSGGFSRFFSLDAWMDKLIANLPPEVQRTFPFLIVSKASTRERNMGLAEDRREPLRWNRGGEWQNIERVVRNTHPTLKPLKLMLYLIILATKPGYIVLDPFMGSGTTLMAAKMLGRSAIGIEIDPRWFAVAEKRIEAAEGQPAMFRE